LKIRNVESYRNYDKSEFADKSALLDGDDEKLETLWKKEYSLKEFTDPSNFKSYEVLKAKLDKVLGFDGGSFVKTKAEDAVFKKFDDDDVSVIDKKIVEHDDEDLDYFKSLAEKE
jgi:hypothetical protein